MAPVQWWDARIDGEDRGRSFTYRAVPVRGTPGAPSLVEQAAASLKVKVPLPVEGPIGTYFNRAVVSSQAFSKKFGAVPRGEKLHRALAWPAKGLEWVIPALEQFRGQGSLVYNDTKRDHSNDAGVTRLEDRLELGPRTKAAIIHDAFLVRLIA